MASRGRKRTFGFFNIFLVFFVQIFIGQLYWILEAARTRVSQKPADTRLHSCSVSTQPFMQFMPISDFPVDELKTDLK